MANLVGAKHRLRQEFGLRITSGGAVVDVFANTRNDRIIVDASGVEGLESDWFDSGQVSARVTTVMKGRRGYGYGVDHVRQTRELPLTDWVEPAEPLR